jgi:esterase
MAELDLATISSRAEAELRFEARVDDWAMRKFLTTNLDRSSDGRWQWTINLPALTAALPHLEKNPLTEADHYSGPTKFIIGERSRYVLPEDHEAIRRHFPSATVVTVANSGHNPHMEQRPAFVRSVLHV